jgi:rRNA maturation RNase YbeY
MLSIRNLTRSSVPKVPFDKALSHLLPSWEMSLVFVGEQRAQAFNVSLRQKDYVPNVLSYEVGKKSGEVIICPMVARRECKKYDLSPEHFMLYLFIHALVHLKGHPHGATMEQLERATFARFVPLPPTWHDASQQASISARTRRKSWSSKKS